MRRSRNSKSGSAVLVLYRVRPMHESPLALSAAEIEDLKGGLPGNRRVVMLAESRGDV